MMLRETATQMLKPAGENAGRSFFPSNHAPISRRSLLSLAFLWPAARFLRAQQDKTISVNVKVVNVFATVRNKQGQIVRDLVRDDFHLEEDDRPQVIRYFSKESDLPLTLGLLVDTSMSQRTVLGQERNASYKFLDQVLREDKDMAFVIHFDREVELLQDLTSSKNKLQSALAKLEDRPQMQRRDSSDPRDSRGRGYGRGGGTALYDAVLLASDEIMKKQSGRKALIVLSDGVDRGSKMTLPDAIASAQRADTLTYSIYFVGEQPGYNSGGFGGGRGMGRRGGMGGPGRMPTEERPDGKKILERVSKETGGAFFNVSHKQPLDKTFDEIQNELRNQYSLGYTPDKTDAGPGYRKIRVTTNQNGLIVQARDGYYAD